MMISDMKPSE